MAGVRAGLRCPTARGIFASPWCHLTHTLGDQLCSVLNLLISCWLHPPPAPQVRLWRQMHQMPPGKGLQAAVPGVFLDAGWSRGGGRCGKFPNQKELSICLESSGLGPPSTLAPILLKFGFSPPLSGGKRILRMQWGFCLVWGFFPDLCGVPSPWHSSVLF